MSPPMYTEMAFEPKFPLEVHLKVSENVLKAGGWLSQTIKVGGNIWIGFVSTSNFLPNSSSVLCPPLSVTFLRLYFLNPGISISPEAPSVRGSHGLSA